MRFGRKTCAASAGRREPWPSGTTAARCTTRSTTTTASGGICGASPSTATGRIEKGAAPVRRRVPNKDRGVSKREESDDDVRRPGSSGRLALDVFPPSAAGGRRRACVWRRRLAAARPCRRKDRRHFDYDGVPGAERDGWRLQHVRTAHRGFAENSRRALHL